MIKNLLEKYYRFSYRVETLPSPLVYTLGLILTIVISPFVLLNWLIEESIEGISGHKSETRLPRGWVLVWYLLLSVLGVNTIYNVIFTVILTIIIDSYLRSKPNPKAGDL